MSDGISRIELKNSTGYGRYQDSSEQEETGLLGTAADSVLPIRDPNAPRAGYEEEGLLPVLIENGLEKIGVL